MEYRSLTSIRQDASERQQPCGRFLKHWLPCRQIRFDEDGGDDPLCFRPCPFQRVNEVRQRNIVYTGRGGFQTAKRVHSLGEDTLDRKA